MTSIYKLGWYGLPRQAIPGVMLGMERVGQHLQDTPEGALAGSADIAVGFHLDELPNLRAPRIAVIPDQKVAELLSWLHTFSHETFPLSQYCRVLSQTDWRKLSQQGESDWNLPRRGRWASLVAGEMLGQAEATGPITSAPLGWAHGCLSYALARTVMVYGTSQIDPPITVAERLGKFEADQVFQRKRIRAKTLSAIWPYVEQQHSLDNDLANAVHAVVSTVNPQLGLSLRANAGLASSSAERRVQGFDEAVEQAMALRNLHGGQRQAMGTMLAGAALLVGSGTSHISLIEPYARDCPEAYAWFGLMAGIAGPKSWDPDWMRLAKGVERLLSANYALADAPQADLSWLEYEWVSKLAGSPTEVYSGLPKQNARSLTVELVPGVACQFRFAGTSTGQGKAAEVSFARAPIATPPSEDPRADISAERLAKARDLIRELQSLFSASDANGPPQSALFGSLPPPPAPTKKKNHSSKKASAKVRDG